MAGDSGLLRLRAAALAIWLACVLLIVVPAVRGSSDTPGVPFQQPVQPPGPHPGYPLKD